MTRDDIRMAREAGFGAGAGQVWTEHREGICTEELERFAALVAAAEREARAKVCECASKPREGEMHSDAQWAGLVLSAAIRARSKE
jgi:hypothetical protein